jgi:hypothetical protein
MLLNEQGDGTNLTNVGNYEFLEVQSITGNLITFTTNKTKYYGNGASDDINIGTTAGDSWTDFDPTDAPNTMGYGAALVYPSSGDYIYAFRGGISVDFLTYSISNNNWTTFDPTDAPAATDSGASLVYPNSGDYIYALRGGMTFINRALLCIPDLEITYIPLKGIRRLHFGLTRYLTTIGQPLIRPMRQAL